MKIDVYTVVRNEEYMIEYFLRHYSTFAERIFVFDDHCTDKTMEIAGRYPKVTRIGYPFNNGFNEEDFAQCYYDAYQTYSRPHGTDWVICVDCDELVYDPYILSFFRYAKEQKLQVIYNHAYFMLSENLPQTKGQIYEECKQGVRFRKYDKPTIYDPSIEFKYGSGRHTATYPEDTNIGKYLMMLHYRYLSRDYFVDRITKNFERMPNKEDFEYRLKRGLQWYRWALRKKEWIL